MSPAQIQERALLVRAAASGPVFTPPRSARRARGSI